MSEMTAERFAQRVFDFDLLDAHQLDAVWGELGSREVSLEHLTALMLRRELLTNFQVDRILEGKHDGYYYGKYKALYLVGTGTFARVYRAVHRGTNRLYAVKVLRSRYAEDLTITDQFMREARMVMPLVHPNIVPVHEVLEERHRPFMVMDFVEGQNLREFIKRRKRLDLDVSLSLLRDVLSGLHYAAGKGVTHRDLKLSNVLITSRGRAKLVDFGLAAISMDPSDDEAGASNPRSIDYAGLERITGVRKNDPRSDIYFAGCMLYHMLSGQSPLVETRDRVTRLSVTRYRDIKPLGAHLSELPNYLIAFCNKSMELNPERRFQSPGEMLEETKRVLARVEAKDDGTRPTVPAAESASDGAEPVGELPIEMEGGNRTVLIVEPNVTMQDTLRSALKKCGYRVLLFANPDRALERLAEHDDAAPLADCLIVSANELGDQAVALFNRLGSDEKTKGMPAVMLVNRRSKAQIAQASTSDVRVLLPMGIKIKQLRATLLQLLNQPGRQPQS
ncbi:MAG: serine/threonine protein kinase [Planctomycetes bacterium]|nr:serine/threonine protein kinase [Planctomycetota bacterium]